MFFNKLKEELKEEFKEYLKDRIAFFAEIYTKDVIKGLKATYKTLEELIAEYKHTKWEKLTPFEAEILIDRFNLVRYSNFAIYRGKDSLYSCSDYIGDTLKDACDKERKESNQEEKNISIPPVTDKDKLNLISAIVEYQKSTVKAVKVIKEVLKDVE